MAEAPIDLIRYAPLSQWEPRVGDFIIKHGFIRRTIWFGVVNGIDGNDVSIIKEGLVGLLVELSPHEYDSNATIMSRIRIRRSMAGSYSICQIDPTTKLPVWYV